MPERDVDDLSLEERICEAESRVEALAAEVRALGGSPPPVRARPATETRAIRYRDNDPTAALEHHLEGLHDQAALLAIHRARLQSRKAARRDLQWGGVAAFVERRNLMLLVAATPLIGLIYAVTENLLVAGVCFGIAIGGTVIMHVIHGFSGGR